MNKMEKQERKVFYQKNKERILKERKLHYQNPKTKLRRKKYLQRPHVKEKGKINCRKYSEKNKEKISKQKKEYVQRSGVKKHKKEYSKQYFQENKRRFKEYSKEYFEKNKEQIKQNQKKYQIINKIQIKIKNKEYHQKKEVMKKRNEYRRRRYNENISFRIESRCRKLLTQALTRFSKTGKIMSSNKYGIDYNAIIECLKPFPKNMENYHIDHIIPVSWFDFNNLEEIKWAFAPENHQWLTIEENLKKGNRYMSISNN